MQILIILLFLVVASSLTTPKMKGYVGELGVRLVLKRLKKEEFEVLHNIMLMKDGKTTQIDHIIVGQTGIFVVETKNYKGWIFGSEHSKFWTQTIYKSKKRFQNPIHQNYGHIKFLEHHLQDYSGPYYSVIAFSNKGTLKKVDIISEGIHVVNTLHLLRVIRSKKVNGMSNDSVRRVAEMIRDANCMNKKASKIHVQMIQKNQKIIKAKISQNICPKCGNELMRNKVKTVNS